MPVQFDRFEDEARIRSAAESVCPGCGLGMPVSASASYDGYYNCSRECWSVYAEVLGEQFSNAIVFGQCHQLTVDAYAVQHPGGVHPDKSIAVHLVGLHAAFELSVHQMRIARLLQQLAASVSEWPHFPPPTAASGELETVFSVAMSGSAAEHVTQAKAWAHAVWTKWEQHHDAIRRFAVAHGIG